MTALKKTEPMSIEEFIQNYEGSRCQFHEGKIWEAHATTPDHSYLQGSLAEVLRKLFNKTSGPKAPGGWWIFPEIAVRYANTSLFSHDLAGWRRSRFPERPRKFPIADLPDWVCEILSTNSKSDLLTKKTVLHQQEVPYYWIVHPTEKVLTVFKWQHEGYALLMEVSEGFIGRVPPFEAVELKANVLFGEEDE